MKFDPFGGIDLPLDVAVRFETCDAANRPPPRRAPPVINGDGRADCGKPMIIVRKRADCEKTYGRSVIRDERADCEPM